MELDIRAASWTGPVRSKNEDMASVAGILLRDDGTRMQTEVDPQTPLYLLVADGLGGHQNGEFASERLQDHLRYCFTMGDIQPGTFAEDISREVGYVSAKLNARAAYEGQLRPMGTTLTGVVFMEGRIWAIGAGDSRSYLFRDGFLTRLTTDHEDADGLLVNCIGAGLEPFVEVNDITGKVADDDILLICSDGLTDLVSDDEIEYLLTTAADPLEALYLRACDNGGTDNVSIILAKVGSSFESPEEECPDDDGRWDAYV